MSTRTMLFLVAGALGVLVIALTRDDPPSARQQALRDDAMASYIPPGGTLVDTRSQNEGTSLGKPVAAVYARMFELPRGTAARALTHAAAAARAAGWGPVATSSAFPDVFNADRTVRTGRISLAVAIFRDARVLPDDVEPPALLVTLRHSGS
ncbi:MAG: hypothetical protein ACRDNB_07650 [Gaiellaceae bacterium]